MNGTGPGAPLPGGGNEKTDMSTRTFPQSPTASSHLRPDRRQWTWVIGGVFALLFVLGLAASCEQSREGESARPVPTGSVVLAPAVVPESTLPPAATYEVRASERIAAPEPARTREPVHYEDCASDPVHRVDHRSERDGDGCDA